MAGPTTVVHGSLRCRGSHMLTAGQLVPLLLFVTACSGPSAACPAPPGGGSLASSSPACSRASARSWPSAGCPASPASSTCSAWECLCSSRGVEATEWARRVTPCTPRASWCTPLSTMSPAACTVSLTPRVTSCTPALARSWTLSITTSCMPSRAWALLRRASSVRSRRYSWASSSFRSAPSARSSTPLLRPVSAWKMPCSSCVGRSGWKVRASAACW
mmetsp:Transcript_32632/g.101695  ORF Transcript_32632/g.101695 Transcript_32632/m.101695 type:complete len:218 (+) Transcript_32632:125-778(+)